MSIKDKIFEMYDNGEITANQAYKAITFSQDLEKVAFRNPLPKNAKTRESLINRAITALLIGGAAGAGGALVNAGVQSFDQVGMSFAAKRNFQRMLDSSPSLKNEDEEQLRGIFNTLARFAPSLAADPNAAASYVKRIMQFDPETGGDYNVIKTLTDLEKAHQQGRVSRLQGPGAGMGLANNLQSGIAKTVLDPGNF